MVILDFVVNHKVNLPFGVKIFAGMSLSGF